MKSLQNTITENEKRLEGEIPRLRRDTGGFLNPQKYRDQCGAAIPIALGIIASGRDLTSAIVTLEMDLKTDAAAAQSIGAYRIDASRAAVLRGITAYNQLIKQFRQTADWLRNPPDFVSM